MAWSRTPTGFHARSRIFLRQKLLDRSRKKLIEELIRVGRLIDPAPNTGQTEGDGPAELSGDEQQFNVDPLSQVVDPENPPIVEDVVDRPYATKDMFADFSRPLERQRPVISARDSSNTPVNEPVGPIATHLANKPNQATTGIGFPVEELARELVTLIGDRVSQRSGEQLDDTFRDELIQAVTAELESWLK